MKVIKTTRSEVGACLCCPAHSWCELEPAFGELSRRSVLRPLPAPRVTPLPPRCPPLSRLWWAGTEGPAAPCEILTCLKMSVTLWYQVCSASPLFSNWVFFYLIFCLLSFPVTLIFKKREHDFHSSWQRLEHFSSVQILCSADILWQTLCWVLLNIDVAVGHSCHSPFCVWRTRGSSRLELDLGPIASKWQSLSEGKVQPPTCSQTAHGPVENIFVLFIF